MDNVLFNYVVGGVVVEGPIPYREVLARTGLKDTVGLTELGWVEIISAPEEPEITKEQIMLGIRNLRKYLLQESDWTQLPDNKLTTEQKVLWSTYRQQLRDMPETFKDATKITEVIVPTAPNAMVE
jgi:hypothetical protein